MTNAERTAVSRLAKYVEIRKDVVERIQLLQLKFTELQDDLAALNARKASLDDQADADLALLKGL